MNAREVIEGQIGKWPTTYLLDALRHAGFVILPRSEVEAIRDKALEEAAAAIQCGCEHPDCDFDRAAATIRKLKSGGE